MFSIIIPYYNKANYIQGCVNSVLNQTCTDYEIIIVNDGSTDNGLDFLLNTKHNIKIINQENKGVSDARNIGIINAKNQYIAFLDADDCWHHNYLKQVNELILKETKVKIIGCHYSRDSNFLNLDSQNLDYFKFNNYFKSALKNTYFTSSSTVIAKHFFTNNDAFNPMLKSGEDIDMWLRTVYSGGNAFYITNTLVYYSNEDENQVTNSHQELKNTLLGNINSLYKNIQNTSDSKSLKKFVSIYVYFNLYTYYYDKQQHNEAKLVLKQNENFYFLLHLLYLLPFSVGEKLVKSVIYKRYIRLYLKFIIRYFYSI